MPRFSRVSFGPMGLTLVRQNIYPTDHCGAISRMALKSLTLVKVGPVTT